MRHEVSVFRPYPFSLGQKIRIEGSKRAGDWEVAAISEDTVALRCPISGKKFEWPVFCYVVEEETNSVWPRK